VRSTLVEKKTRFEPNVKREGQEDPDELKVEPREKNPKRALRAIRRECDAGRTKRGLGLAIRNPEQPFAANRFNCVVIKGPHRQSR
jgi:hypothetical protein